MTNADMHMARNSEDEIDADETSVERLVHLYWGRRGGHFFDGKTLEFFGESFSTMTVQSELVERVTSNGNVYTCYVLETLQHIPTDKFDGSKFPRICRVFFDVKTMNDIDREYEDICEKTSI